MNFNFNPIADNRLAYFPRKYANQAILFYMVSLAACTILFMSQAMPLYILAIGIVSILLFFNGSFSLGKKWSRLNEKRFLKNVFWYAFWIRFAYVILIYVCNMWQYGHFYESSTGDILFYVPEAIEAAGRNSLNIFASIREWMNYGKSLEVSDMGYLAYLSFIFSLLFVQSGTEPSFALLWLPLLLKVLYGSLTCVLMYKLALRHFGENVARMTAVFCMLQWNMIWWCGSMMKETEMIFLVTLFIERMDRVLYGLNLKPWFIAITVLIGLSLFTFRSALFMVAFAATILALVMTRSQSLSIGKKILAGLMIAVAMSFALGETIVKEVSSMIDRAQDTEYRQRNMDWRSTNSYGKGGSGGSNISGNQFAKYASAAVFAPLIFTIPFPNMVYTYQEQEMQMQVNGGNFEKNILSFFIIFALFQLLFSGQWRQHVFPIAYYVGYLAALVLSVFAQSGRFHMPIMPMAMMFGAYGLTLVSNKKHKQWFNYALMIEVVFCIGWSWFKLKGRGLI